MSLVSFFTRSLRGKLLLFSLALVVVPGAVFAVIARAGARRALENAVGRQLAEVANDAADGVAGDLAEARINIRTWARQDLMREVVIGDLDKRVSRFLVGLRESDGRYFDLLCTDAKGRVVAATNPGFLGESRRDHPWYRAAIAGNEVISGPVVLPERQGVAVEIAAPIYDPERSGVVIGALLGLYDWSWVLSTIDRIRQNLLSLGLNVDILILDESGVVIGGPTQGKHAALAGQNLRAAGWLAAQRSIPLLELLNPGPRRKGRAGSVVERRASALVGFAPVKDARPGWSTLAVQPLREALAPVYRMQRQLFLVFSAVLLVGLAVATLLAERMSRPLRALTRATQAIARGEAPRRPVRVRSRDEIGELAESFNTMSGDLKRAQDELLVAARFASIGEVAAGVAHEVRTPLGILRSSAQLLGRLVPKDRAEAGELLSTIIDEVDRLDRVVDELLQLARPHQPQMEPTALAPILSRALDLVEPQAREKKLVLRRDFELEQAPAQCDPDQIYQVALNLIVNAVQILPRGGSITVRTTGAEKGRVAFEVSDDGPGVPPELREQIFTPFFTTREAGTGLGLALVQRVVQAHKGRVSVKGRMGDGATFRVELPASEETE